jgi:hypothetical protein
VSFDDPTKSRVPLSPPPPLLRYRSTASPAVDATDGDDGDDCPLTTPTSGVLRRACCTGGFLN